MQHSFYLDRRSVRVSVTQDGKQTRRATGIILHDPRLWDSKAVSLKAKCRDRRVLSEIMLIHSRLAEMEALSVTDVGKALDYALGYEKPAEEASTPSRPSFWEYFEEWGNRPSSSKRQRALVVRVVARLMGKKEDWDGIDSAYWFRLQMKMEEEGFSVNYRWNIGSRLKCVMHEGFKLKYHNNQDFREFKTRKEQTEAIALSPSEIDLLWQYEPKSGVYGAVRDLALIGYYSAARFSDYSQLSLDNICGDRLQFVQKKTGDKVIIPASPRLVHLLERNGGHAPKVCQVVFNRYIKVVARDAGIEGLVAVRGELVPRWKMVQSHSFRRSALTTLYLSGAAIKDCMMVSGHKDIKSFQAYLRIQKEEAVGRLAQNDFFK